MMQAFFLFRFLLILKVYLKTQLEKISKQHSIYSQSILETSIEQFTPYFSNFHHHLLFVNVLKFSIYEGIARLASQ